MLSNCADALRCLLCLGSFDPINWCNISHAVQRISFPFQCPLPTINFQFFVTEWPRTARIGWNQNSKCDNVEECWAKFDIRGQYLSAYHGSFETGICNYIWPSTAALSWSSMNPWCVSGTHDMFCISQIYQMDTSPAGTFHFPDIRYIKGPQRW